jgi:hypothetical protein
LGAAKQKTTPEDPESNLIELKKILTRTKIKKIQ